MIARAALGAVLAAAVGTAAEPASAAPDPRVSARLDPRVELENVLERLAGPRRGEKPELFEDSPEAKAIDERFGRFRGHPAVGLHKSARSSSFPPDIRLLALFAVSDPPELEPRRPLPSFTAGGGTSGVEEWLAALRRFALETDFASFVSERERLVEPELEQMRKLVESGDWIRKLEAYVGLPFEGRLVFEVSPARTRGLNEAAMLPDGTSEVTCLVRSRGYPLPLASRDMAARLVFHEAGHGILDTLVLLHADELPQLGPGENGSPACDRGRLRCVEEHVVRAVMIRLVAREFGEPAAERLLEQESSPDFPKLAEMTRALRGYESDRKRWPTLAAYFPRWIEPLGPQRLVPTPPGELAAALGRRFKTPGQRKRAARWLEKELEGGSSPELAARRDALRSLK